ncbi:MAG: UDP-N-acetylglucosamine 1-carboxyvinyltransferase [Oscillospiraceae bacterium]|nr:UDP-N-acetylglucosamine 1-carboxyvinyltransferase [Oscillospiraceae bacterium]
MTKYVIKGGKPLNGKVFVSGAKNAAVAIVPAALMVEGTCRVENIPQISDVTLLLKILEEMGANISTVNRHTMDINCSNIRTDFIPFELMRKIRASYYLLGAMLARFGHAQASLPGGCDFGVRPIDQHIKGFTALGAEVEVKNGIITASVPSGRLHGAQIYMDVVSVGATINVMLAAAMAEGKTTIENAAREPHIVDTANFLNSMGADIRGAGTNVIKINGVDRLSGSSYSIIPDQIEAGTYIAAAAAAGGEVLIENVIPKHLECITAKFEEMGVECIPYPDSILIRRNSPLRRTNVKTMPYPGFPTDMQPQTCVTLCFAEGTSVITEAVWDNRYKYIDELKRMGARVHVDGKVAVVEGVPGLTGAPVKACDLRAGAALVIAGLCASGITEVEDAHYIARGYEDFEGKLRGIGADIICVETPDVEDISLSAI